MPNSNNKLVDALVEAFNVNNCTCGIMDTNFTTDGHHITAMFGGGMEETECKKYLESLRDTIEDAFHRSRPEKKDQGPFYLDSFPFNPKDGRIFKDKKTGKFKYAVLMNDKVLFNLQAHFIYSMTRPTKAAVHGDIYPHRHKNGQYIMCDNFESEEIAEDFKQRFCAEMLRELKCDISSFVTVAGRNVYISRNLVNNVGFIQRCVQYNTETIGCALEIPGIDDDSNNISKREFVLQELLTQFIRHTTGIVIHSYYHTVSKKSGERCLLLPAIAVKDEKGNIEFRYLNVSEVQAINVALGYSVVSNLAEDISDERIISEANKKKFGVDGIDFSNREVSQHVCNTVFNNAVAVQVNEDGYGLEVQSSPYIAMLRAKVDKFYAQEAQLQAQAAQQAQEAQLQAQEAQQAQAAQMRQEALSRAAELLAYANAAQSRAESNQLRAEAAQSQARATISYVEAAQLKVEANGLYSKAAHLRVEAVKSRAKAAQYYEEASQLHAEIAQSPVEVDKFHTEEAHFRAEAAKLDEEIKNKQNKKEKVSKSTCRTSDQFSLRSVASSSSDDTTDNPPNPTCSSSSNNFGNSNNGTRSGNDGTQTQTLGNNNGTRSGKSETQTEGYIPPPPPFPEDKQDQPVITAKSLLFPHRPLAQKNSNSSGYLSVPDSGHNSLKRGTTPPSQNISTYSNTAPSVNPAKKYQPKHKSLLSRVRSFFGIAKKGKSSEDSFQHSISEVSATRIVSGASVVSADSAISLGSNYVDSPKGGVSSKLSNLRVEREGQIIG